MKYSNQWEGEDIFKHLPYHCFDLSCALVKVTKLHNWLLMFFIAFKGQGLKITYSNFRFVIILGLKII